MSNPDLVLDAIYELRKEMTVRFDHVEQRLDKVEQRLDKVEQRLDKVEQRLDKVEQRLDKVEQHLGRVDDRFEEQQDFFLRLLMDSERGQREERQLAMAGMRDYIDIKLQQQTDQLNGEIALIHRALVEHIAQREGSMRDMQRTTTRHEADISDIKYRLARIEAKLKE